VDTVVDTSRGQRGCVRESSGSLQELITTNMVTKPELEKRGLGGHGPPANLVPGVDDTA